MELEVSEHGGGGTSGLQRARRTGMGTGSRAEETRAGQIALHHRAARMCRVLGVCPSGYYAWRKRGLRRREDAALLERVRRIWEESGRTYGAPRVWTELQACGVRCSRKRVARLMGQARLVGASPGGGGGGPRCKTHGQPLRVPEPPHVCAEDAPRPRPLGSAPLPTTLIDLGACPGNPRTAGI